MRASQQRQRRGGLIRWRGWTDLTVWAPAAPPPQPFPAPPIGPTAQPCMLQTVSRPLGGQRQVSLSTELGACWHHGFAGFHGTSPPLKTGHALASPNSSSQALQVLEFWTPSPPTLTPASSTRPWRGRQTSPAGGNKESRSQCGIPSSHGASGMVQHSNPLRTFCAFRGSMGSSNRGIYGQIYPNGRTAAKVLLNTGAVEVPLGADADGTSRGTTPRQHTSRWIPLLQADKFKHTSPVSPSRPSGSHASIFFASFYSSSFPGGWQFPQPYPQPDHLSTAKETPKRQHREETPGYLWVSCPPPKRLSMPLKCQMPSRVLIPDADVPKPLDFFCFLPPSFILLVLDFV